MRLSISRTVLVVAIVALTALMVTATEDSDAADEPCADCVDETLEGGDTGASLLDCSVDAEYNDTSGLCPCAPGPSRGCFEPECECEECGEHSTNKTTTTENTTAEPSTTAPELAASDGSFVASSGDASGASNEANEDDCTCVAGWDVDPASGQCAVYDPVGLLSADDPQQADSSSAESTASPTTAPHPASRMEYAKRSRQTAVDTETTSSTEAPASRNAGRAPALGSTVDFRRMTQKGFLLENLMRAASIVNGISWLWLVRYLVPQ